MYYSIYKDELYAADIGVELLDGQALLCKLRFLVWATDCHIVE